MSNTPNLLVIMSDEHQARALGCAGHFVKTPNLDQLAARGTRFTKAYTPSPICVPARASFATGQYVHNTRLWDNAMPYHGQIPGWGHALQSKSVPVESIGKLHYRHAADPHGFDTSHIPMMVVDGVGMIFASIRREEERIPAPRRMLGDAIGKGESTYTKYDTAVTARTKEWIAAHAADDAPWCLYVGLVAPHFPLIAPPEFYDLYPPGSLPEPKAHPSTGYQRHPWVEKQYEFDRSEERFRGPDERLAALSAYFGLVSWLDHNVGEILSTLDANGLRDRTTVAYTSDHGDNAGARGLWGKSNMYEESVAVPMILSGSGIGVGTCDTPVSLLDLSETIIEHFDAALPGDRPGRSLYDIAKEPTDAERTVLSEYHAAGAVTASYMLRNGRWKYIHYVGFEPELFDLENDPDELTNLGADPAFAETLAAFEAALRARLDPEAVDAMAHADQKALVEAFGGRDAAMLETRAATGTPPPQL